jgi:hypothetical protein
LDPGGIRYAPARFLRLFFLDPLRGNVPWFSPLARVAAIFVLFACIGLLPLYFAIDDFARTLRRILL